MIKLYYIKVLPWRITMDKDTKYCVNCGEKIPKSARFCEKCGSAQPELDSSPKATAEDQVAKKGPRKKHIWSKWWFWLLVIICIFLVALGLRFAVNHTKGPDTIASEIQSGLRHDTTDYGDAKVSWNDDAEVMEVRLPTDSRVIRSTYQGETALWNSLVRELQDDSKKIARDNNKKYSYIEIMAPKSSKYVWLEVDQGKIKYNTADNLK